MILEGTLVSGVGEGRRFLEVPKYRRGIHRVLSFDPYPGTLNLRLTPDSAARREALREGGGRRIPGFRYRGENYGEVLVYPARLLGKEVGVLFPSRSAHPEGILEVVAPCCLREVLGLKDGDRVVLEISPEGE